MQGHLEQHGHKHHQKKEHHKNQKEEHHQHKKEEHKHHKKEERYGDSQEEMSHDHPHHFWAFLTHPLAHPMVTILAIASIVAGFFAVKHFHLCPVHLIHQALAHFHPGFLMHEAAQRLQGSQLPEMFFDGLNLVLESGAPTGPHF